MIIRKIEQQIKKDLFKGKVIILYGARRVGKTTLTTEILKDYTEIGRYINCEIISNKVNLEILDPDKLKNFIGNYKLIILDEAQNIQNIGKALKILIDTYPEIQIIATGSSSFDLANKTAESLTGRAFRFMLYPLAVEELKDNNQPYALNDKLENILRFGSYPEILEKNEDEAKRILDEITSNYLYKDLLMFEGIKKSQFIFKLLQLLALQIGNEVSYHELAQNLKVSDGMVQRYIDLLEKAFVVFELRSFSRNLRKEIAKNVKIYFWDLGIRNSLIQNHNPLSIRNDIGGLWENFCISERLKFNKNNQRFVNSYFWRTYDQKEIDYIEEYNGKLEGYEFKYSQEKFKKPKDFLETYENSSIELINKNNYLSFLT